MAERESSRAAVRELSSDQLEQYTERSSGRIQAQVSSFANGLEIYRNISIVRIRSRQSNLLIMEDYMPIIGELDGYVDLIGKNFIKTLENVKGFFCHEHNVFFLILKDAPKDDDVDISEEI